MINYQTKTARQELLDLYDQDDFKNICYGGCISGAASHHIYYHDTTTFYDEHEGEILNELELVYGNPFAEFATNCDNITHLKNALTWAFIELISQQELQD